MKTSRWKFGAALALVSGFGVVGIVAVQRENQPVYWLCFAAIYFGTLAWLR